MMLYLVFSMRHLHQHLPTNPKKIYDFIEVAFQREVRALRQTEAKKSD